MRNEYLGIAADWYARTHGSDSALHVVESDGGPYELVRWDHAFPQPESWDGVIVSAVRDLATTRIREQARERIDHHWPDVLRVETLAGLYGPDERDQLELDLVAVAAARQAALDEIAAAETVEQIEAVTADWPELPVPLED